MFILSRLPLVAFWNWFNLLTFNLANQRLQNSILEDNLNKPWRPIPSQRISPDEARLLLLFLLPVGIILSYFIGGFNETIAMIILTWMYNDLGGGDVHYFIRNLINSGGFISHASGSTAIAAGYGLYDLNGTAPYWLAIIGGIILTTMQVQDIPDMEGDAARGRKTFPLVYGGLAARISVAVGVMTWSFVCPTFWSVDVAGYLLLVIPGAVVTYCTLTYRSVSADEATYKIWCVWLIIVYLLPLYKNPEVFSRWGNDLLTSVIRSDLV